MEKSDKDKMFDNLQQKGLDELQKFFDGGGKLDFSEVGSVDEIADLMRSGFEKVSDKRNEHFDYPSDFFEHPFYPEYEKWLAEEIEAGRLPPPWSDVVKMSEAGKRGAEAGRELGEAYRLGVTINLSIPHNPGKIKRFFRWILAKIRGDVPVKWTQSDGKVCNGWAKCSEVEKVRGGEILTEHEDDYRERLLGKIRCTTHLEYAEQALTNADMWNRDPAVFIPIGVMIDLTESECIKLAANYRFSLDDIKRLFWRGRP